MIKLIYLILFCKNFLLKLFNIYLFKMYDMIIIFFLNNYDYKIYILNLTVQCI